MSTQERPPPVKETRPTHHALGNQFHGTTATLQEGDVIGAPSATGEKTGWGGGISSPDHTYATTSLDDARKWAETRSALTARYNADSYPVAVYAVEPVDHSDVEYDPNFPDTNTDEHPSGIRMRSTSGFRVISNVTKHTTNPYDVGTTGASPDTDV
jgi:hypothetical protein